MSLPDCLSMQFDIGDDYFRLLIDNPTEWAMTPAMNQAQGKLIAAIGEANRQLRAAAQHCKHFTGIPYSTVVKPVSDELEKEFQNFRSIVENHADICDLYKLHGDKRGFVRHWRYMNPHKKHPDFYILNFCCLGGKYWFGPAGKYPSKK